MILFENGIVRTSVEGQDEVEALAVDGGSIAAVGSRAEVEAVAGPGASRVDLRGRALGPGFIDAHHHLSFAALFEGCVDCSPGAAPDHAALAARLRAAAASRERGAWIVGYGYDEQAMRERRHPTRAELDAACPEHPVFVYHYTCHEGVASTKAFELARVDARTPDPPGGAIARDRRGQPSGHLRETAICPVERLARADRVSRDDGLVARLGRASRRLFAAGITRICDPTVSPDIAALYRAAKASGELTLPVVMMQVSPNGYLIPPLDALEAARVGDGPEDLRTCGVKAIMDGGVGCALTFSLGQLVVTVARSAVRGLRERSLAQARLAGRLDLRLEGARVKAGMLLMERETADALVRRATERDTPLAIHASGNLAVDQAVRAIAAAGHPPGRAHRIEHALFLSPDLARRLADAGITAAMQPHFLQLPAFETAPVPAGLVTLPLRSLLDAGVRIAGSSDAPVTSFEVTDAMRAAVRRTSARGRPLDPEEAITPAEVLAMYTREAARACGCLDVTGTLERGKRADLVVLSRDPCAPRVDLDDVRVDATYLAGKQVYARP
jgi:predicted amidohydrolase YtcJ